MGGFPAIRADGGQFAREYFHQVTKETRVEASIIAEDINIGKFEPGFDEQGERRPMPTPGPVDLKSGGLRMLPGSPSALERQPTPKLRVDKPGQVNESAPGNSRRT